MGPSGTFRGMSSPTRQGGNGEEGAMGYDINQWREITLCKRRNRGPNLGLTYEWQGKFSSLAIFRARAIRDHKELACMTSNICGHPQKRKNTSKLEEVHAKC